MGTDSRQMKLRVYKLWAQTLDKKPQSHVFSSHTQSFRHFEGIEETTKEEKDQRRRLTFNLRESTPSRKPPEKDPRPPGKVHTDLGLDKRAETTEAHHLPKPPPPLGQPRPQKLWRPDLRKYSDDKHQPKPQTARLFK